MARALRVAGWVVGGLVGLVVLAALFLVFVFDWGWLRGTAGERAGRALDRDVAIAAIDVDLGRVTRIRLGGVRVGNPAWTKAAEMAQFESIDVAVRLWPLLTGTVELDFVRLTRPVVRLEKHPDGRTNWQFGENPKAAAAAEAAAPEHRGEFPIIHRLTIDDGRLSYRAPADGIDLDTRIDTATGGDPANRRVTLEGSGTIEGQPTRIDLEGGSLLELREGGTPYPLRVQAEIGPTRLRTAGTISEPVKLTGFDLDLMAAGPDLAALGVVIGVPLPKTRPYRLEGKLLRQGPNWTVRGFDGRVGDSDLAGGATLVTGGKRPVFRANLVSDRLALADLAGLVGAEPGKEDVTKGPDKVLPARDLDIARLRTIDMDVHFTGRRVEAPGLPIDGLDARVVVEDGRARFQPLVFEIAQGAFAGGVMLDATGEVPAASIDMTVTRVDLRRFLAGSRFADETSGTLAGRVELSGRGRNTADVLAEADGRVTLLMADGSLSNLALEAAGLDIAEALGFVLTRDRAVPVRCLVADFAVQSGIATSGTLVLDTTDTVVTGRGRIDFASEAMDLRLVANPKDPSPLAARAPVLIGGTLGDPSIAIDPAAPAAKGGLAAALGALVTPLAAILPFLEPGLGEDQPCAELIQQAQAP